jgi:hypothetical protein
MLRFSCLDSSNRQQNGAVSETATLLKLRSLPIAEASQNSKRRWPLSPRTPRITSQLLNLDENTPVISHPFHLPLRFGDVRLNVKLHWWLHIFLGKSTDEILIEDMSNVNREAGN